MKHSRILEDPPDPVTVVRQFPVPSELDVLARSLSWAHLITLCALQDPGLRSEVAQTALEEGWSMQDLKTRLSPYRWLVWSVKRKKWLVRFKGKFGTLILGDFRDEDRAAEAYDRAALAEYGPYAQLNFPDPSAGPPPGTRFTPPAVLVSVDGRPLQVDPGDLPLLARHRWRSRPGRLHDPHRELGGPPRAAGAGSPPGSLLAAPLQGWR